MFNNNTYTNFKATYTRYFCDGTMLKNYLNHKFQWLQEGLNSESPEYEVVT